MLNLVQLQERLKDVPMQSLMQYANGMNPQIPPFLALGELNRRKKMQENAAAEQAKEMAGAPSIKQQIEQAVGLMSLQGARQQAAMQQAASQQAAMPMPATNTAQSEPVQLAEGGMIDPVGERDYMGGGAVSPDMEEGLAAIPLRNMFKRSDYAGGGIVAFSGKDSSYVDPVGLAPYEQVSEEEKRLYDPDPKSIFRRLAELVASGDPDFYKTKEEKKSKPKRDDSVMPPDVASGEYADRKLREAGVRYAQPEKGPEQFPASAVPREGRGIAGLPDIIQKYLSLDPDKMEVYKAPERETAEQYKQRIAGLNTLFGVAQDPYADLKKRYADIEAQDRKSRAEQPMDQLTRFLTGIAGSRRGAKFGEAGSAGVTAAADLRAQQEALNRKQDLDMAALRSAIAEREDARARGDRDKFLAADKEVQDATRALQKDKINLIQSQAQMMNQARQVGASEVSAQAALMNAMRDRSGEPRLADARVKDALDRLEKNPEYKLLLISKKPEDRVKADKMRQDTIAQAIRGYEAGATPSAGNRMRFDAQGNPIQ